MESFLPCIGNSPSLPAFVSMTRVFLSCRAALRCASSRAWQLPSLARRLQLPYCALRETTRKTITLIENKGEDRAPNFPPSEAGGQGKRLRRPRPRLVSARCWLELFWQKLP